MAHHRLLDRCTVQYIQKMYFEPTMQVNKGKMISPIDPGLLCGDYIGVGAGSRCAEFLDCLSAASQESGPVEGTGYRRSYSLISNHRKRELNVGPNHLFLS